MTGEHTQATRLLAEAETVISGLDYPPGRLSAVQARVFSGFFSGDLDLVTAAAAEGVMLARVASDHYVLEIMLLNLGSAALLAGDPDRGQPLLAEALNLAEQIDDRVAQFYLLAALGCAAALSGRPRDAARLISAAEAAQAQAGIGVVLFLGATLDTARQAAGAALGAVSFTAEVAAGRALSRDAALAVALRRPAAPASAEEPETGPLSPREAEVARLVAEGLTNRQIGRRLLISERTVDSRVRAILGKLGAGSRAQVAAWATATRR